MIRTTSLILAALSVTAVANAESADTRYLQGLGVTEYWSVDSDFVGRGYHIYVRLPDGYESNPDEYYPTVYLLDGGNLYPMLSAYYGYLRLAEEVPDSIIVGISYGSSTFEGGNFRGTDYTAPSEEREHWGGAGDFQQFLAEELIPAVESRYRSLDSRRIVFGQSLGGQFVLYTAFTRPDLFWGHIASNPALHRNLEFYLQNHSKAAAGEAKTRLFVASASNDEPRFREPALAWIEHWSGVDDLPWTLEIVTLEGHSHMSAPPASFRRGMRWLFDR